MRKRGKNSARIKIKLEDEKFRQEILKRDKFCQWCGQKEFRKLQVAHIFSRMFKKIRHDKNNALVLCYSCHIFKQKREPVSFYFLCEKKFGRKVLEKLYKKIAVKKR